MSKGNKISDIFLLKRRPSAASRKIARAAFKSFGEIIKLKTSTLAS